MTIKLLLDAIGEAEGARPDYWSGSPYDLTLGRLKLTPPVSQRSISDIKKLQHSMVEGGMMSGAVGKYQFIASTLSDLQDKMKFADTDILSPELQDSMAIKLLERRGLKRFLSGDLHLYEFMKNLSKEWASLPNPETGKSYYGQRTHFTVKQMIPLLEGML